MSSRAVARGPGDSGTGGAAAGEGEREGTLPFGSPLTAAGIVGWVSGSQWGDMGVGKRWAGVGACLREEAYIWVLASRARENVTISSGRAPEAQMPGTLAPWLQRSGQA